MKKHTTTEGKRTQKENIAKRGPVIWAEYESKLNQLDILFRFVQCAFSNLSETKRQNFVKSLKKQQESHIAKKIEKLREFKLEGIIPDYQDYALKKIKGYFRSKAHTQYAEWVSDGMTSSEILFRVTIFEDFLKHVHAVILKANSSVFSSASPTKTANYEEIFSESFDNFKEQQICREVEELDRQGMKLRLEYFAKHLGIDLSKLRESLIEISDIRNNIAHGNPLQAIVRDKPILPLDDIQKAVAETIKKAMSITFSSGNTRYPKYFRRIK